MAASSGDGGGGAWSTASVRSRRAAPPVPAPRRGGGDDSSPGAGELTEAVEGLEDRKRWLDEYDIPVEASGEGAPVPLAPADGYEAAGLAEAVLRNAASCGYEGPSPVQCYATPIVMGGRDLMACAHTGSGKTTALCLPVVSDLVAAAGGYRRRDTESFDRKAKPRALVLAPTRAAQVKAGGDINGKGSVAFTLWNEGSTYFISLLLKAGADPNLSDDVQDTASNANSNRSLAKLKMDDDKGALLDAYQMLIRCYQKAAAHMLLKAKDIIEFGPFDEMYAKRLVKDCDPNTALPCDEGEEGYAVCFDGPLKVGKPDFYMTVNGKNLEGLLLSKMVGAGRKRKRKNNTAVHEPMVPPQPPSRVWQAKREKRPNLRRRVTLHTNTRVPPDTIRRIKYGTRSRMDAKAWTCKGCGQVNRPVRYIVADLPPLRCINKKCNKPLPDDYEFSFTMARACVNGSCPIGNIKDQEQTDECSLYNTCGALEITERMAKLLVGEVPCGKDAEGPILSTKDLLAKFEEMMRLHDINTGWGDNKFNITTLLAACDIAVREGIKHLDDHEAVPQVHKASGKRRVPCRFSEIAKKLANGTPLIGVINTGKKFGDLKNGHIYKAPPNKDVPG